MVNTHKLSFSGKVAAALALCYVALPVSAEILPANTQTEVLRKGKIEIINIANPTASGLSHNQYQKFNVAKQGAVLNNGMAESNSQLAGNVARNKNLSRSAKVILNEVVSRNPSVLAGKQEVVGQRADYVLANPNGISCQDCGFINTPRATLVAGKATVSNGKLTGYDVKGDQAVTSSGKLHTQNVDTLDFIAPKVRVESEISGVKTVNVVQGRNTLGRDEQGTLSISSTQHSGTILDGTVAGSIEAGRIRIHSTDNRASLNVANAKFNAKEMDVTAGKANFVGKKTATNNNSAKGSANAETISKVRTEQYHATEISADRLTINVNDKLNLAGTKITAKKADIQSGGIHLGTERTVNTTEKTSRRSKGRWYRNEAESSQVETLHSTTLAVDDLNLKARKDKITGQAVKFKVKEATLYAEQGVKLQGGVQTETHFAQSDFRNESAKLKTGRSTQSAAVQHLNPTELKVENKLVLAGNGDMIFEGVKGELDGTLVITNQGKSKFVSQTTHNYFQLDDKHKFWGGLAGSKTLGTGRTEQVENGSDITIKGLAYLDSENGTVLKGSRVLAGEGYVRAGKGDLVIDSAKSHTNQYENSRKGTIFDITKARSSHYQQTTTAQGSELKSQANLALLADNDISVIGSKIAADGKLSLNANGKVQFKGATNSQSIQAQQAGFDLSGKVNKPVVKLSEEGLVNGAIDFVKNKTKLTSEGVKDYLVGNLKVDAQASATLGIYHNQQASQATTHSATEITGTSVSVQAKQVDVVGSKVKATAGDLSVQAENVNVLAQQNVKQTSEKATQAGITTTLHLTEKNLTNTVEIGVQHSQKQHLESQAQTSELTAKQNVNLKAEKITHQGSQVTAGQTIVETAKQVKHLSAQNQQQSAEKKATIGLTVVASIDKQKAINGSATLAAEVNSEKSTGTNQVVSHLNAGKGINVEATRLVDQGTGYQTDGDLNLHSKQHSLVSATDSEQTRHFTTGISVGVEASTKDLQSVDLDVNASANFQTDKTASTTPQKPSLNAKNVHIQTGRLDSQADISAKESVTIQATQGANFVQSNQTQSSVGGGVDVNVGVGALVVPSAGVAIPSIDVGATVNGHKSQQSNAVLANIAGKNVAIESQKQTHLQGTNLQATDTASVQGSQVKISAGKGQTQSVAVNVGAGVGVGASVSDVKLKANLNVKHEDSQAVNGVNVAAQKVSIAAENGVAIAGSVIRAEKADIQTGKGDLVLTAPKATVNKTEVGANLALNGGVKDQKWLPSGGSASLKVDVVRNQQHASSQINADEVNLAVGGNALLQGSQIQGNQVNGTIAGNLHSSEAVNKVKETKVDLSASGSGKFTPYPADKWQASAKKDWNSGTIAGVKADVKVNAKAKRQSSVAKAGVSAKKNRVNVKGHQAHQKVAVAKDRYFAMNAHLNSNMPEMVKRAQADLQNKQVPWVKIERK